MEDQRFKTMRHIETVRNYIGLMICELLGRAEQHDQTKLASPEKEIFDEYTPRLRGVTYGSAEYKAMMKEMKVAIDHHNANNRHHPEFHPNGISDMTLIDLLEMMCDWKAATLRHHDGDIFKSIEHNKDRFGMSEQLRRILKNTAELLNSTSTYQKANES